MDVPIETLRSQMDTNYWAAAYLAHATMKSWLKPVSSKTDGSTAAKKDSKPRHFIMTSSVGALVGLAGYCTYAPAKAAMRSLADNLRSEVNLYNGYRRANPSLGPSNDVKIHCVFPATITSPGYDHENTVKHPVTKILEEGDPKQNEDEVAAASVKGLEKGGYLISTQMLGEAMRVSMLGGSPRNNWILDTMFSWVVSVVSSTVFIPYLTRCCNLLVNMDGKLTSGRYGYSLDRIWRVRFGNGVRRIRLICRSKEYRRNLRKLV